MRTFYVYMHNATDRRDDDVYKVRARDEAEAKEKAVKAMDWPGRFYLGWVMPARPENKRDREFLKAYRWWATDKT